MADQPDYKSFKFFHNCQEMSRMKGQRRMAIENRLKDDGIVAQANGSVEGPGLETQSMSPDEPGRLQEGKKVSAENTMFHSDAPDLMVFLQDSNDQFVNEFFLDREVLSRSRCWDHNRISYILDCDEDSNSESTRGTLETVSSTTSSELKNAVPERDFRRESVKQFDSEGLMTESEEESEIGSNNLPTRKIVRPRQLVQEVPTGKADFASSFISSVTEDIADNTKEASFNNDLENGSIVHDSDSSVTTVSSLEEYQQSPDPSEATRKFMPLHLFAKQNVHEESSSFVVDPFFSQSYSGPIPYSGSISVRSNSSTGSSHSFAFPILTSEWSGSPVRMVEADQKQLPRNQSWRICFLCCKF